MALQCRPAVLRGGPWGVVVQLPELDAKELQKEQHSPGFFLTLIVPDTGS